MKAISRPFRQGFRAGRDQDGSRRPAVEKQKRYNGDPGLWARCRDRRSVFARPVGSRQIPRTFAAFMPSNITEHRARRQRRPQTRSRWISAPKEREMAGIEVNRDRWCNARTLALNKDSGGACRGGSGRAQRAAQPPSRATRSGRSRGSPESSEAPQDFEYAGATATKDRSGGVGVSVASSTRRRGRTMA